IDGRENPFVRLPLIALDLSPGEIHGFHLNLVIAIRIDQIPIRVHSLRRDFDHALAKLFIRQRGILLANLDLAARIVIAQAAPQRRAYAPRAPTNAFPATCRSMRDDSISRLFESVSATASSSEICASVRMPTLRAGTTTRTGLDAAACGSCPNTISGASNATK